MKTFTIYDAATGVIDRVWSGDEEWLPLNTKPGQAFIGGAHDGARQRVDIETGELVTYQPPKPVGDELRDWTWDANLCRWLPVPTRAAREIEARARRNTLLAECDWTQLPDVPAATKTAWAPYRQALRDLPEDPAWPDMDWPTFTA
jgi:hypothetical protein